MTRPVDLWDAFVEAGMRDSGAVERAVASLTPTKIRDPDLRATLDDRAGVLFRIAYQALLLGAEDVAGLALACERVLTMLAGNDLDLDAALPPLIEATDLLREAFDVLARPDASGARTEGLALAEARTRLEAVVPEHAGAARGRTPVSVGTAPLPVTSAATEVADTAEPAESMPAAPAVDSDQIEVDRIWQPTVDSDMLELFFEEASERIEDLSVKLLDIEQRPGDEELLRDIFRDLHTLKGSSAMVALTPMNQLAHAAEDLVGQLRDGARSADGPVIDALLAALDGLRDILRLAQGQQPIDLDFAPIVRRLRDPRSAPAPAATTGSDDTTAEPTETAAAEPAPRRVARQTIRVDFDKLDRLLNLVGELVLGRDGLRTAIQALSSVSAELSSDRHLTRRLIAARRAIRGTVAAVAEVSTSPAFSANGALQPGGAVRETLATLGDELSRVERVLVEIAQDLDHATGRLDSVSDDLRDQVMKLRMVPIAGVFRKHHRTVRDLAHALGKRVRLELGGEETELDKLLVEALDEPLMHLIRNAVDHGVEPPEERLRAGKAAEGVIRLTAAHRGNQMVIQIRDDGKGIDAASLRERARERGVLTEEELEAFDDRQILDVIFRPGFSTAAKVSEVSGRGVGMDVVRQTIVSRLKGVIEIDSTVGRGSTFTLKLPLTLAIIQVLLARTGGEVFAIPLDPVIRTVSYPANAVQYVRDRELIAVRGRQVPLIRLTSVLELEEDPYASHERLEIVLVELANEVYGLACENLLGKKEIVIKSLGDLLENVPCAAGATLLGDRCAIILDVPAIVQRALRGDAPAAAPRSRTSGEPALGDEVDGEDAPQVLLVEDSETVRETLRRLLVEGGYRCTTAVDGVEGLAAAKRQRFDLVSTDVMMPRMDGYELTRALRRLREYKDTPIVMVTSRGERIDRVRGFDAGVDEYITKPHDRQLLLRVVRKLLSGSKRGGGQ